MGRGGTLPAVKFLPSQFAYLLSGSGQRQNLRALFSYAAVLVASIVAFTVLFHVIMVYEHQDHSWIQCLR